MSYRARITVAFVVMMVGAIVFSATLVHALWYAPDDEIAVVNPTPAHLAHAQPSLASSSPQRLQIPALGINANVQEVGINAKGNMGVPNNFSDVAWYKYGVVPGEVGSAVIDGHVDNGLGLDGVFKHLGDIHIGDDVFIETQGGARLHFVVSDIESYPYQEAPDAAIFNKSDGSRLNLITCEGKWVKADKTYDQRLVVYTRLVPQR